MSKKIYEAVANLPEELITQAIADAAIEEGNIELLNSLPHKFLTGTIIMSIIERNSDTYSWRGFDLKNIPENLRAKEVCEYAVKKDNNNILHTPKEHLSAELLSELLTTTERNLKYLHMFLDEAWTADLLLQGVKSIYTKTTQQYGPRGGYHGSKTINELKPVLIFMSYVPDTLKTAEFYASLFDTRMTMEDIETITPTQQKGKAFYLRIAEKDFKVVPPKFHDYDILLAAIENKQIEIVERYYSSYGRRKEEIEAEKQAFKALQAKIFAVMDARMADAVISAKPDSFNSLPQKFQTSKRLILAIQNSERDKITRLDGNEKIFTEEVCKAYIYRNKDLPTLPESIWNEQFVDCCMMYGTAFNWFDQLPKTLQTSVIVEKAMGYNLNYAQHVRPELITLERAQELYRSSTHLHSCIPTHYLQDFGNETGLSAEFFGGEVSYSELREKRVKNTYCRLGHSFIAYSDDSTWNCKSYTITLTRRTPASFRPIQLFSRNVQTFHSTWLEKLIADNDAAFTKPTPCSKAEKPFQVNAYFSLSKIEEFEGVAIYANSLLGERIYFTAQIGDNVETATTLQEIKKIITEQKTKTAA